MDSVNFSRKSLNEAIWKQRYNFQQSNQTTSSYLQFLFALLKQNISEEIENELVSSIGVISEKIKKSTDTKSFSLLLKVLVCLDSKDKAVEPNLIRSISDLINAHFEGLSEKEKGALRLFNEYCRLKFGVETKTIETKLPTTVTNFHKTVLEACLLAGFDFEIDPPSMISKDIVLTEFMNKPVSNICVEVNGPLHFYRNGEKNYLSELKRKVIELEGFQCVTVDWNTFQGKEFEVERLRRVGDRYFSKKAMI